MEGMDMDEAEIKELIARHSIKLAGDGKIAIFRAKPRDFDKVRANKAAIVEYLKADEERKVAAKKASDARAEQLGVKAIRALSLAWEAWHDELNNNIYSGRSGAGLRSKPSETMEEIRARFPRGAAYLDARAKEARAERTAGSFERSRIERDIWRSVAEEIWSNDECDVSTLFADADAKIGALPPVEYCD